MVKAKEKAREKGKAGAPMVTAGEKEKEREEKD